MAATVRAVTAWVVCSNYDRLHRSRALAYLDAAARRISECLWDRGCSTDEVEHWWLGDDGRNPHSTKVQHRFAEILASRDRDHSTQPNVSQLREKLARSRATWRKRRKLQGRRHRAQMNERMRALQSAKAKRHELYVALKRSESEAQMYREALEAERAKPAAIVAVLQAFGGDNLSDEERYILAQAAEHIETLIESDALAAGSES